MKNLLNERRGHTIHSLREYAIVLLRFLGIERTDENILIMVDKIIDILVEMKPSDVVFDVGGEIHPKTRLPHMRESKRKIKITETQLKNLLLSESEEGQKVFKIKEPEYKRIDRIEYNFDSDKPQLLITISIHNPSRFNIKIMDYDVDVKIDGNKIGNVKMVGEPVVLRKRKTTKLTLPLDINTDSKDIINMVVYYLKNKKSKHTIELDGTITGRALMITKELPLYKKESFEIGSIKNFNNIVDLIHLGEYDYLRKDAKKIVNKIFNYFD